jgi:hypothetical protein
MSYPQRVRHQAFAKLGIGMIDAIVRRAQAGAIAPDSAGRDPKGRFAEWGMMDMCR